jgi:ceramide glucosyltransferase
VKLSWFFLAVAGAGLLSSTSYFLLSTMAAIRFRRRARTARGSDPVLPRVTLFKPVCGQEPGLEENLESFFRQDYPNFEIVFGARDSSDAALPIVRDLQRRYPEVKVKVIFSGEPDRPNAKVCSLEKMHSAATTDYFVISDSDVRVTADYLRNVIAPLVDGSADLVFCLYRGVPTQGLWSRLEALGMSVEMTSGVIVAGLLEGIKFALGPTMAIRRDALQATGGFGALAEYCADDYVLGHAVDKSGRKVALSTHVIDHVANHSSFKGSIRHQVRWMKSTRFSRPKGHIGTGLTFAMPFGILGLIIGFAAGHSRIGLGLFGWAVIISTWLALVVGWGVVRDRRALRFCWLYPVRDLMGFCFWCASFFGREILWRGVRYRLEFGGKMVRTGASEVSEQDSRAVTVDNLA